MKDKILPLEGWALHKNPDGSTGGQVFDGANVDPNAIIESTAVVMPGAVVKSGEIIKRGTVVTPENIHFKFK